MLASISLLDYMRRQVLKQTEQEIKEIDKQINSEREAGIILDPEAEMDPALWILALEDLKGQCLLNNRK